MAINNVIPINRDGRTITQAGINRIAIRLWLHVIGEENPQIIHEILEACRTNKSALEYYLNAARDKCIELDMHNTEKK